MCGYCYEGIMLHVVETGYRGTKAYRFSYLQESEDIKTEIQQLEDPNNPEPLIDQAFCRLYDHYFAHGFDVELFNILQAKLGMKRSKLTSPEGKAVSVDSKWNSVI